MDYLQQVQRGIDYIEDNLTFDVQAADVASHAGISRWHFQRIFKALTNETLAVYIRSRRFAQALDKLANTQERVLDIALASGYDTQESFTRSFKKAFSVTPAHYRKYASRFAFMKKVRFDLDYLNHLNCSLSLEPEIYEQAEMLVVGMRTIFYGVDSEKNNIAQKLPKLWADFLPRLNEVPNIIPGGGYGVIRQITELSDQLEYWATVAVTHIDMLPSNMDSLRVPSERYARFAHRGLVANVNKSVNYIYSTWLLSSGMHHTYGCDLEYYGTEYEPDSEKSVIYYAIPVATN